LSGYRLRSAHKRLALRVGKSTDYVNITLPDDERLFRSLLASKEYQAETTDKCRYVNGMINLLGGYEQAKVLKDPGLQELLNAMQDGTAFTLLEMNHFFKPGGKQSQHQKIESIAADLALKGIFLRGYRLQCPACDLRRWYSLNEMAETMRCAGCLTRLQPPLEAPFHYRLNELFVRGIEQGAIPLLLTILVLSRLGHESYLFVPGLKIANRSKAVDIDVDIIAACNGHLVVAESKDLQGSYTPKSIRKLIDQLHGIAHVAQDIGARIVVVGAMLKEVPQELDGAVHNMRQEYPDLAIHLALRADLERGYLALGGSETPVKVSDLLPKQQTDESGHISEPGPRFVTF
jgi:hypothetical protein